MADSLSTIGSIATFIVESLPSVSTGVSGNMVEIVDTNRQHVANFVGTDIGSNSIADAYQPPIVSLSKADTIDFINAETGDNLKLGELTVADSNGDSMSATAWRMLADSQLKAIGRKARFTRVIN